MSANTKESLNKQIKRLTSHLEREQPELVSVVHSFRELDKVAYRLGLLDRTESFAMQVSWWPLIAVLGTFSSGKSTFINAILGRRLQTTGNQAVDDKYTVICYGRDETPRVLPGLALDADPRFPLYRISSEIEGEMAGEGSRLDTYLQLKTSDSEALRGRIYIDSPGFDADEQRTSTLRITRQIIDISDLVLVFFDARHPEPGAMRDTLEHLVGGTLRRADFNKFLYILNQIDNAAREDNPEEVFAAWQRALAQKGLTAGRFYQIYDKDSAAPIENEALRRRFEKRREHDMAEIRSRIDQLEIERSYRVTGSLEQTAKDIRDRLVPRLYTARAAWKRRVLWLDAIVFGGLAVLAIVLNSNYGSWNIPADWAPWIADNALAASIIAAVVIAGLWLLHRGLRRLASKGIRKKLEHDAALGGEAPAVARAFAHNVGSWWPFSASRPAGWSKGTRRRLDRVLNDAHAAIQRLNDRYTDPAGTNRGAAVAEPARRASEPGSRGTDGAKGFAVASPSPSAASAPAARANEPAPSAATTSGSAPPVTASSASALSASAAAPSEPTGRDEGEPVPAPASADESASPASGDESAEASAARENDRRMSILRGGSAG